MVPVIKFIWLPEADQSIKKPEYETAGSAGADVRANFEPGSRTGIDLLPGERKLIPTGLSLEIPSGFEVQVRPRSGLALKRGITCLNTPGTIDSDYRGPVGVILINLGNEPVHIEHGDRIAQLIVAPVAQANFVETEALSGSERGAGGFGSTGLA